MQGDSVGLPTAFSLLNSSYEFNRLIHGFSVGFTGEIIHSYELNRLIDGFHLSSFLKSSIVMD